MKGSDTCLRWPLEHPGGIRQFPARRPKQKSNLLKVLLGSTTRRYCPSAHPDIQVKGAVRLQPLAGVLPIPRDCTSLLCRELREGPGCPKTSSQRQGQQSA